MKHIIAHATSIRLTMSKRVVLKMYAGKISCRDFTSTPALGMDFTHAVVGGGAVGLAIARQLSQRENTSTILIERHRHVGTETSSRNSEVIHAGLYYGPDSLKTRLCIQGKDMMYELCDRFAIPYKRCGKWIVAQSEEEMETLHKIYDFSKTIRVPTRFIPLDKAASLEPSIHAQIGVLESPSTGILDSHSYMQYLLGSFLSSGGDVAYNTSVIAISPLGTSSIPYKFGYRITTVDNSTKEETSFETETLINSAGLGACYINSLLLPLQHHRHPVFAKGNYFSYTPNLPPNISHLIYPAPQPRLGGLGTHLTIDLAGQLRFGPDIEFVKSPDDLSVSAERLPEAISEIKKYFPSIQVDKVQPDYAGIRPKLSRGSAVAGKEFVDFYIEEEALAGFEGFVNLLGIESPGLTASLAIAEMVDEKLYR